MRRLGPGSRVDPAASGSFCAWQRARDVPLTGADCFLRAFDAECRARGRAGHLSQIVLRLGPGFDVARFRTTLDDATEAHPILHAVVRRGLRSPFPVYATTRPVPVAIPIGLHVAAEGGLDAEPVPGRPSTLSPAPAVERELSGVLPPEEGRLLRADVVERPDGGSDVALTFAHLLFDGFGSERFVAWLAACGEGERRVDDLSAAEGAGLEHGTDLGGWRALRGEGAFWRNLRARGDRARRWQHHVRSLGDPPPRSLAGPLDDSPQRTRYEVLHVSEAGTEQCLARARAVAGELTPALFPLAASLQAHAAVLAGRGATGAGLVVPVAVNARPRGEVGAARAIFRSHVSMLWLRAVADPSADLEGLVRSLQAQRLASVKEKLLEDGLVALDLARLAPRRTYARLVRSTFGGELASFFFAYTGELLPERRSFFGAPIETGFHVPGVPASPGSALVFSHRDGRLAITHVWQEGTIEDAELRLLRARLLLDLDAVGPP